MMILSTPLSASLCTAQSQIQPNSSLQNCTSVCIVIDAHHCNWLHCTVLHDHATAQISFHLRPNQCRAHMGSVREWVGARWRGLRNFLQRTKQQCGVDVWYCSEPLQHDATTQWDIAQKFALANCRRQRNNVKLSIYIKKNPHTNIKQHLHSPLLHSAEQLIELLGWLVSVAVYYVAFCHWVAAIEYSIETNARACFILSSVLYCARRACVRYTFSILRTNTFSIMQKYIQHRGQIWWKARLDLPYKSFAAFNITLTAPAQPDDQLEIPLLPK